MVISIQNQKGGVGKSATAVALAGVAYESGRRCLLVDLDPQGSATQHLAADLIGGVGIGHVLLGEVSIEAAMHAARPAEAPPAMRRWSLDIVHGDDGLLAAESYLRETKDLLALRRALMLLRHQYDLIVVDVGPSISQLAMNALYAAEVIVCPVTLTSTSLRGVRRLYELTSRAANQGHQPGVFILPVAADSRLRETREILQALYETFGRHPKGTVLRPIRYSSAVSRAFGERRTIVEYDTAHQRANGNPDPAARRAVEDFARVLDSLLSVPRNHVETYA